MTIKKYDKMTPKVFELVKKESPITTAKVADKLKINWATAQRALYENEKQGKIKGKSLSGRNVWWVKLK